MAVAGEMKAAVIVNFMMEIILVKYPDYFHLRYLKFEEGDEHVKVIWHLEGAQKSFNFQLSAITNKPHIFSRLETRCVIVLLVLFMTNNHIASDSLFFKLSTV